MKTGAMQGLTLAYLILSNWASLSIAKPISTAAQDGGVKYWDIEDLSIDTNDERVRSMAFSLIPRGDGVLPNKQQCTASWLVGAIPVSGLSQPFECEEDEQTKTFWQPSENLMNMDPSRERWSLAIWESVKNPNSCTAFQGRTDMVDIDMQAVFPQDTSPVLLTKCANSKCKFYGGNDARRRVMMTTSVTKDECDEQPTSLFH